MLDKRCLDYKQREGTAHIVFLVQSTGVWQLPTISTHWMNEWLLTARLGVTVQLCAWKSGKRCKML